MGVKKEDVYFDGGGGLNLSETILPPFPTQPTFLEDLLNHRREAEVEEGQEGVQEGVIEKTSQKRTLNNAPS